MSDPATSADAVDQTASGDAAEGTSEPDVDLDGLKAAVASAADEATLRAELERQKRATGHIPSLISRLDALDKKLADLDALKQASQATAERLDALLDAIPEGIISERLRASLRPVSGDTNSEVLRKLAELEQKLASRESPQPEVDPRVEAVRAQWEAATQAVEDYAKRQGVAVEQIEDVVWQRAMSANRDNPTAAAVEVMKHVDSLKRANERRAEKKDAGAGNTNKAGTTRSGPLSVGALKNMTVDEIRAVMREDPKAIEAALAGS